MGKNRSLNLTVLPKVSMELVPNSDNLSLTISNESLNNFSSVTNFEQSGGHVYNSEQNSNSDCSFNNYILELFSPKGFVSQLEEDLRFEKSKDYLDSFLNFEFFFSLVLLCVINITCVMSGIMMVGKVRFHSGIERRFEIITLKVLDFVFVHMLLLPVVVSNFLHDYIFADWLHFSPSYILTISFLMMFFLHLQQLWLACMAVRRTLALAFPFHYLYHCFNRPRLKLALTLFACAILAAIQPSYILASIILRAKRSCARIPQTTTTSNYLQRFSDSLRTAASPSSISSNSRNTADVINGGGAGYQRRRRESYFMSFPPNSVPTTTSLMYLVVPNCIMCICYLLQAFIAHKHQQEIRLNTILPQHHHHHHDHHHRNSTVEGLNLDSTTCSNSHADRNHHLLPHHQHSHVTMTATAARAQRGANRNSWQKLKYNGGAMGIGGDAGLIVGGTRKIRPKRSSSETITCRVHHPQQIKKQNTRDKLKNMWNRGKKYWGITFGIVLSLFHTATQLYFIILSAYWDIYDTRQDSPMHDVILTWFEGYYLFLYPCLNTVLFILNNKEVKQHMSSLVKGGRSRKQSLPDYVANGTTVQVRSPSMAKLRKESKTQTFSKVWRIYRGSNSSTESAVSYT